MRFHRIAGLLAAVAAVVLSIGLGVVGTDAASAASAPAGCERATGECIWAGYGTSVVEAYTEISGDFPVPKVKGTKNGTVAFWDGLGGTSCNDPLEQTGVSASIHNGKTVYKAWWQVIYFNLQPKLGTHCWNRWQAADNPHFLQQTVKPGDWFGASVSYSSSPVATGGTYYLHLQDDTEGWSVNVPVTAKGINGSTSRDSAESIVEDVGQSPLPDFGTVFPGNVRVYPSSRLDYGWTQQNPVEYTLGTGKVYIAPLGLGGDFSVTWRHS